MGREVWSQARIPLTSNTPPPPSLVQRAVVRELGQRAWLAGGQCLLSVVWEGRSVSQIAHSEKVKLRNNDMPWAFSTLKKQVSYRLDYYYHGNMRRRGEISSRTVPGSSQAASQQCRATSSVTMATKIRSAFATLTETIFWSSSVNQIEYWWCKLEWYIFFKH